MLQRSIMTPLKPRSFAQVRLCPNCLEFTASQIGEGIHVIEALERARLPLQHLFKSAALSGKTPSVLHLRDRIRSDIRHMCNTLTGEANTRLPMKKIFEGKSSVRLAGWPEGESCIILSTFFSNIPRNTASTQNQRVDVGTM